jgi:hypothetical protein
LIAAHSHDLALLQDAQQIGLVLQTDIADFVKEHSAAAGRFELAFSPVLGAGERSFLLAEQLAARRNDK